MTLFGISVDQFNGVQKDINYKDDPHFVDCGEFCTAVSDTDRYDDGPRKGTDAHNKQQARIIQFVNDNANHETFQAMVGNDGVIDASDIESFIYAEIQKYPDDKFLKPKSTTTSAVDRDNIITYNELDLLFHVVTNQKYGQPHSPPNHDCYAHIKAGKFETLWSPEFGQERKDYGPPNPVPNDANDLARRLGALPQGLQPTTVLMVAAQEAKPLGALLLTVMEQQTSQVNLQMHKLQLHPRPFYALNSALEGKDIDFQTLNAIFQTQKAIEQANADGGDTTRLKATLADLISNTPTIPAGMRVRLGVREPQLTDAN